MTATFDRRQAAAAGLWQWTRNAAESAAASEQTGGFIRNCEFLTFSPLPELTMARSTFDVAVYSDELYPRLDIPLPDSVSNSVPKRKAEFLAGRFLSGILLEHWGLPRNLGVGKHRQPLWPGNWRGSITHTDDTAMTCLIPAAPGVTLGVDLEGWIDPALAERIDGTIVGRREWRVLPENWLPAQALTLAFSAKESLFKAIYADVGHYFDFDCAELVEVDPRAAAFTLRLTTSLAPDILKGQLYRGYFDATEKGVTTILTNCEPGGRVTTPQARTRPPIALR